MRYNSTILKILCLIFIFSSFVLPVYALPTSTVSTTLLPNSSTTSTIGSASRAWPFGYFNSLLVGTSTQMLLDSSGISSTVDLLISAFDAITLSAPASIDISSGDVINLTSLTNGINLIGNTNVVGNLGVGTPALSDSFVVAGTSVMDSLTLNNDLVLHPNGTTLSFTTLENPFAGGTYFPLLHGIDNNASDYVGAQNNFIIADPENDGAGLAFLSQSGSYSGISWTPGATFGSLGRLQYVGLWEGLGGVTYNSTDVNTTNGFYTTLELGGKSAGSDVVGTPIGLQFSGRRSDGFLGTKVQTGNISSVFTSINSSTYASDLVFYVQDYQSQTKPKEALRIKSNLDVTVGSTTALSTFRVNSATLFSQADHGLLIRSTDASTTCVRLTFASDTSMTSSTTTCPN